VLCVLRGVVQQAAADDAMNAMLANLKLPVEEKVEVTYTTRSGDVVKTRKPLRPLGHTFVLSGLAPMLCTCVCVLEWY
jgi:hypothetical protein